LVPYLFVLPWALAHACYSVNQNDEPALDVTAERAKAAATTAADNVKSFIAGGFGGASAVLVGTHWPSMSKEHKTLNWPPFRDFQGTPLT
jgi:hypothetical protein